MVEADVMCMGMFLWWKPLDKWCAGFGGSAVNEAMINEYWKMKSAKVDKTRADQFAFCILQ